MGKSSWESLVRLVEAGDMKNKQFALSVTPAESQLLAASVANYISQNKKNIADVSVAGTLTKKLEKLEKEVTTALRIDHDEFVNAPAQDFADDDKAIDGWGK